MTTEMKGDIYVLAYTGTGASQSDDYLDIYDPLGYWLRARQILRSTATRMASMQGALQ